MLRVLPWVLAAGFAGLASFFALRAPAQAAAVPGTAAVGSATPEPVAPAPTAPAFGPLRQCQARLEVAQTRLAASPAPAAVAVAVAVEDDVSAAEKLAARDERRAVVLDSVEEFLGATPDEAKWVMEFVCAVRGLRADVIADLRDGKLKLDEAAARQKAEREDTLADLETFLGKERYTKLRSVGGLGKLGDLFECD